MPLLAFSSLRHAALRIEMKGLQNGRASFETRPPGLLRMTIGV
jgi:hypothetical protein